MTPRTMLIYCDRAPEPWQVAAVRSTVERAPWAETLIFEQVHVWTCSWCGARVKVIA